MNITNKLWITIILTFIGFFVIGIKIQSGLILSLGLCIIIFNALIIFTVTNRFNEVNSALENNKKLYGNDEFNRLHEYLNKKENIIIKSIEDSTLNEINKVLELSKDGIFSKTVISKSSNNLIENIKNNLNLTLNEISAYLTKSEKMLDKFENQKLESQNNLNKEVEKIENTVFSLEDDSKFLYKELINIKNLLNSKALTTVVSTKENINIDELLKNIKDGQKKANQTIEAINNIANEVNLISDAIEQIDQISFQTNILSLNAAVEAATAGETGKGFAVVAQEVRNLASKSSSVANDIKNIVDIASSKTNDGKIIVNDMVKGYTSLNDNITNIISNINKSEYSENQTIDNDEVNKKIHNSIEKLKIIKSKSKQIQELSNGIKNR